MLLSFIDARRHVNKMCMAANVPLVESGTAGYLGQVQPMLKVRFKCRIFTFSKSYLSSGCCTDMSRLSLLFSMILGDYPADMFSRIVRNALTVSPNRPPRLSLYALSARRRRSPFTA
jgi:hypothetical protein